MDDPWHCQLLVTDSSDTYSILIKAPLKNTALRTAMTSVTSAISTTRRPARQARPGCIYILCIYKCTMIFYTYTQVAKYSVYRKGDKSPILKMSTVSMQLNDKNHIKKSPPQQKNNISRTSLTLPMMFLRGTCNVVDVV